MKPSPAGSYARKSAFILILIAMLSATACFDDSSEKKSASSALPLMSMLGADGAGAPESPEVPDRPDMIGSGGGTITVSFNVPSMKNARVYGFVFDDRGAFRGEIGYGETRNLVNGRKTLVVHHARSSYSSITTGEDTIFPDGIYTIHGKFDLRSDGFDSDQGDRGFRVNFAVNGDTAITIADDDVIHPCSELLASSNRPDLKFATVYAYMYFPGGDPLRYFAYRYDGAATYVKLNQNGSDIGNTMSEDLNAGVYDVLIIADMDDSINDPMSPALTNGDKYIVVKGMVIDGVDPIDISDYVFKTYIAAILPAPRVHLQAALNAVTLTITNMAGAASYNVYGRSAEGFALLGTIVRDESGDYTYYNDYGPDDEFDAYGLPANTTLSYRVAAVKSNGAEGELSQWLSVTTGAVQKPEIYGNKVISTSRLDLLVGIPRYCREIEIIALSNSCSGPQLLKYNFPIGEDQRGRESYFSLADFPLSQGMTYAFTVRGRDLHDDWSEPSSCYLFPY
ncbi:MAG TPA: hypothetical protein PLM53_16780 [Spirochaetota bacterium]|nr:hypothetical protein [Spirochaetota bacterium]HPC40008.1 hypothetical protein [Spirochaetota bacterium]HPL16611.1 hypothetical protein [Spirochaetota bacterium]HQF09825.1 hypothetical protein [Spirochaetota bacterium]HQH98753.1 hypothetical protein [Spirochaetota bacterium]